MSELEHKTLRSILDKYSPVVRGISGLRGKALSLIARPLERAVEAAQTLLRWPLGGADNKAGQHISGCRPIVISTFARMEKKLSASFGAAAAYHAAPQVRREFLGLAAEVKADAAVLERHCTILRQKFDVVTERHAFVLSHSLGAPVLLDDAVSHIRGTLDVKPKRWPAIEQQPAPQPQAMAQ